MVEIIYSYICATDSAYGVCCICEAMGAPYNLLFRNEGPFISEMAPGVYDVFEILGYVIRAGRYTIYSNICNFRIEYAITFIVFFFTMMMETG